MGDPITVPRLPRPVPGLVQPTASTSAGGDQLASIRDRHRAARRAGGPRRTAELARRYVDDVGFLLDVIDQAAVLVRRVEGVRDFALAEASESAGARADLEDLEAELSAFVDELNGHGGLWPVDGSLTPAVVATRLLALLDGAHPTPSDGSES